MILNPAPATELDDELLSLVSYLIPNEQEASQETHLPLRFDKSGPWDEDLRNIADTLQGKGVEHVIITLGSYGSAVAETRPAPGMFPVSIWSMWQIPRLPAIPLWARCPPRWLWACPRMRR